MWTNNDYWNDVKEWLAGQESLSRTFLEIILMYADS